ncbi:MAG: TolC family protein, partial [Pirellulales bacterium]
MVLDFGNLSEEPEVAQLRDYIDRIAATRIAVQRLVDATPAELAAMDAAVHLRISQMSVEERETYDIERERLTDNLQLLIERFEATEPELQEVRELVSPDTRAETAERIIVLLTELQSIVSDVGLLQARARIERISVEPIDLAPEVALEIARANRLDWMNNRAALVDVWRLIEFNANRLKSDITIGLSGDVQTVRDNPLSFDQNAGTLRASLQIDPPFTRLVERNVFRQQLIEYQQSRRRLIQYEDGVHQGLRALLRDLEQLRVNLEIQRRAVAIAIRRVDQTRESLNRPIPPAQPGQPAVALGPTVAQDLLFALTDLANAQNSMMSVWIAYEANVMRLHRELGIMQLDDNGLWIDTPIFAAERTTSAEMPLPPELPQSWIDEANRPDEDGGDFAPAPALLPPAESAARVPVQSNTQAPGERRPFVRRRIETT